jgi:outer membrane protein assembly factor BamB
MHRSRLLIPAVILLAAAALAADWPRFRGPNGTGTASDKDVPVKWAAENVLWKAPLPGKGHSSPIVAGGRVFLQSATPKQRLLVCLDAVKGDVLWQKAAPGGKGKTHDFNTMASSTPASDGQRVYTVFWDGKRVGLYAYDFKGALVWHKDLGPFKSQHGPAFSPVVHGGRVFVNNDQDGTARLQAFDARTGDNAWEVRRNAYRACYSTPFILDGNLLVGSTTAITAYDPASGDVVWNYTWTHTGMPLRTVGSPVAADGVVVAPAGDGRGDRAMIAVRTGGKGDVTRTHLAWSKDSATPYVPTLLTLGAHLYAVTDSGVAVCYVAKTGEELWRKRLGPKVGRVAASPVLVDGKVYAIDERGSVYVFAARPEGLNVLAVNSVGESVSSTPAVADGRMYVRGGKHLFCVGKAR